jgi:hypothetical protein
LISLKIGTKIALLSEKMVLTSGRAFVIINLRDLSKTKARPFLSVMNVLAFAGAFIFPKVHLLPGIRSSLFSA